MAKGETDLCRNRLIKYCQGQGLDLGCGNTKIKLEAIGVDFSSPIADMHIDAQLMPCFPNNHFDYIYSSHLLEEIEDTEATLREWLRIVKNGGYIVLYQADKSLYYPLGHENCNPRHRHHFSWEDLWAIFEKISGVELVHHASYPHKPHNEWSFELVIRKGKSIDIIKEEPKNYPIKYSFLFPYCRRESLKSTLISFLHHYPARKDYEVVLIEDLASYEDKPHHDRLMEIINEFKDKINIIYCLDDYRSYNSAKKYNVGFKKSSGQFMILSNPETFHETDVLAGLDSIFKDNPNTYVMCSCQSVHFQKPMIDNYDDYKTCRRDIWYQHSQHNNRMLHFCSAISRENYIKVGGFDETYCAGIAFEDDSFLHRVKFNGVPILLRDDLVTLHIEHSRQYLHDNINLHNINRDLFVSQMNTHNFFQKFV